MKVKISVIAVLLLSAVTLKAQELSLTLEQCREMALTGSNGILAAELDLAAARYQKQEALAEYFPSVSVSAFGFRALDPLIEIGIKDIFGNNDFNNNLQDLVNSFATMNGISPSYTAMDYGYLAGVTVTQPIFAGGRIVNGNRLARVGIEAAQLQKELQERETVGEIDGYFWQVVSLQEKSVTLKEFIELLDTLHRDVSAARAAGLVTEDELLQVELNRNRLKSSELQLRNGLRLAKMNLFNSIGQDYTVISANATEDRPYIDSIVLLNVEPEPQSPDRYYVDEESIAASLEETRMLELNVEAAQLQKKMALGEALPQVAVGAGYAYYDFLGRGDFNGMAFATVQIPISQWGKTSAKMKRLQTQVDKAANQRDYLQSQLVLQIRRYWIDLNSAWDNYNLALESENAARAAFGRVKSNYEAGMVTVAELLQSQASLRQTVEESSEALAQYRQALKNWQDVSGTQD